MSELTLKPIQHFWLSSNLGKFGSKNVLIRWYTIFCLISPSLPNDYKYQTRIEMSNTSPIQHTKHYRCKKFYCTTLLNGLLGACSIKHFSAIINLMSWKDGVFVAVSHFLPSLIFPRLHSKGRLQYGWKNTLAYSGIWLNVASKKFSSLGRMKISISAPL